jgi:hypothetical protein
MNKTLNNTSMCEGKFIQTSHSLCLSRSIVIFVLCISIGIYDII